MFQEIKTTLGRNLTNAKGWRTNRKIIVFESDDWGSIRMPSTSVFYSLKNYGIPVDKSPYCRFDALESNLDMEHLFDLLLAFKDYKGNHPIITANTVVANPDFDAINANSFEKYYYEPFTETLKRYPKHDRVYDLYKEGINEGFFFPQFHGREHVNVEAWMNLLRTNLDFQFAFKYEMWGLSNDVFPKMRSIQAAFDSQNEEFLNKAVKSGLKLFNAMFDYKSESFIANNFIWSISLEKTLAENGVKHLQGMKYQKLPSEKNYPSKLIRHNLGERNKLDQIYSIRNCSFEPSIDGSGYGKTVKEIENAFYWNKPAIISTHRINFIGSLDEENQKKNAIEFKELINIILKKWPEVEFMNTTTLDSIIRSQYE